MQYYLVEKQDYHGKHECKCIVLAKSEKHAYQKGVDQGFLDGNDAYADKNFTRYTLQVTEIFFKDGIMYL
jgi:hypothetical protein